MIPRFPIRYLVPNSLTAGNIVIAALSIALAHEGRFELAAWLIVWCVLLDKADGVVARWLGAQSEFGAQFDSLADLCAFCFAPGLLVYFLLTGDPRYRALYAAPTARLLLGLSALAYITGGAARLARFNATQSALGPRWFRGLPTTIAGALVATSLLSIWRLDLPASVVRWYPAYLWLCALFMVSDLWLPKSWRLRSRALVAIQALIVVLVYGLGFARRWPWLLWLVAVAYPAIGFSYGAYKRSISQADATDDAAQPTNRRT